SYPTENDRFTSCHPCSFFNIFNPKPLIFNYPRIEPITIVRQFNNHFVLFTLHDQKHSSHFSMFDNILQPFLNHTKQNYFLLLRKAISEVTLSVGDEFTFENSRATNTLQFV